MTDTGRDPQLSAEAARALLLRVMRDDSEASYCAGWVTGNEFRLWCQVVRDTVVAGELREAILCQPLRDLAAVAGGWWVWPEESTHTEPSFLPMSQWLPIYEAHRQRLIERYGPEGWAAGLRLAEQDNESVWDLLFKGQTAAAQPEAKEMNRETAIGQLLRLMAEESETNWRCSWGPQHEFVLWACVVGDEPESAKGWVEEPGRLKELATLAGGWFAWSEKADDVEFVPMGQWLAMYGRYRAARSS